MLERPGAPAVLLLHGGGDTPQTLRYLARRAPCARVSRERRRCCPGTAERCANSQRVTADELTSPAAASYDGAARVARLGRASSASRWAARSPCSSRPTTRASGARSRRAVSLDAAAHRVGGCASHRSGASIVPAVSSGDDSVDARSRRARRESRVRRLHRRPRLIALRETMRRARRCAAARLGADARDSVARRQPHRRRPTPSARSRCSARARKRSSG